MLLFFLVLSLTRLNGVQSWSSSRSRHTKESSLNTDLSVAPEIAQLATGFIPVGQDPAAPRTDGRIAGDLADLAAVPQRWWDLVRFDQDRPLRIPVPDAPGAWLFVLPPGSAIDCDCRQATALAGEAVETSSVETSSVATSGAETSSVATSGVAASGVAASSVAASGVETSGNAPTDPARPLRPGRVRVHGTGSLHRLRSVGHGFSVSLHATVTPVRSE